MKKYQAFPALFSVCFATACSNGLEEGKSATTITPVTTTAPAAPPPVQQPQQTATKGTVTLNPPHGQPGHRCDIKVGEPLTGTAPATTINTQPPQMQPVTNTVVAPSAPGTVAAGKNPPHGQPGHRCDIAVGAPLNSKPAQ
ncbi:hypothetical protein ESA94_02760 [Lacibacter luteus]|uniref:Secreted protein n=1 Tax=Lacibacter luteus TaxID=2508719 RepID=A0A4Q1CMN2_9BACT|nr:hypothetical protein [Lacibacter luteus]RXK61951.1 hypothetical protein ESA94_02760 [Lacibacter luteus]